MIMIRTFSYGRKRLFDPSAGETNKHVIRCFMSCEKPAAGAWHPKRQLKQKAAGVKQKAAKVKQNAAGVKQKAAGVKQDA